MAGVMDHDGQRLAGFGVDPHHLHGVVDRTGGIRPETHDSAEFVNHHRLVGLVLAERLGTVVLVEGEIGILVPRLDLAPVHGDPRVPVSSRNSHGLETCDGLLRGRDQCGGKLALPIVLALGTWGRRRVIVRVAEQDIAHRNACGRRDAFAELILVLDHDDVRLDEQYLPGSIGEGQAANVQLVVSVNAVKRRIPQIVTAQVQRFVRRDIGLRETCLDRFGPSPPPSA